MPTKHEKVFLITGASSGIGAETAKLASLHGYRLVLAARSADKLQSLVEEIGGNDRAIAIACDVTDWDSQKRLFTEAVAAFGRIDVVFVNAGLSIGSAIYGGEDTPDEWQTMIMTNIYGAAATSRIALPELVRNKGHLLLTSSVAGRIAAPGSLYSATKWAVTGMTESIRQQLVGTGVRVTSIEPGRVATPFWGSNPPNEPMLQPVDIANAVLYAVNQPEHIDINEMLIRPVGQRI